MGPKGANFGQIRGFFGGCFNGFAAGFANKPNYQLQVGPSHVALLRELKDRRQNVDVWRAASFLASRNRLAFAASVQETPMSDENQIICCMRFSYISKGGFAHSHDPQEQQERLIYDPDRMERRFALFENFALKSLKQQTDQNFKCIFLITQTFPDHYRRRLEDLIGDWEPGIIISKPFMPQFRAIRACFEDVQSDGLKWVTTFRLDDDDMLDKRFVERVRRLAVPLAEVRGDGRPLIISFNKGVYLEVKEDGNRIFDACERTPLSVGAAMITHTGKRENIYSRNHRKLAAFFPAYSDVDEPSWLRTIHQDNDSVPEFTGVLDKREPEDVDQWLDDAFGVTREWLMDFGHD